MTTVKLHTGPGVFEVLVNVCRNPQEALKQFVENAADAANILKYLEYLPVGRVPVIDGLGSCRPIKRMQSGDYLVSLFFCIKGFNHVSCRSCLKQIVVYPFLQYRRGKGHPEVPLLDGEVYLSDDPQHWC